jgi:hypothetical protein
MAAVRLRLLTATLTAAAVCADAAAAHAAAYYLLVAAVPAATLAAFGGLGGVVDGSAAQPADRLQTLLSALVLPFLLAAGALRAPLVVEGPPPTLAASALVACLAVVGLQGLVAAVSALGGATRRLPAPAPAEAEPLVAVDRRAA